MNDRFPLRVAIWDDDDNALRWSTKLLTRDRRTAVAYTSRSPAELLRLLTTAERLDVVLLDVEYLPPQPSLFAFITSVKTLQPNAAVVCLSQYGAADALHAALVANARGFLLKNEVGPAIASAVTQAYFGRFTITTGIEASPDDRFYPLLAPGDRLQPWRPNPRLSPRLLECAWLRIVYGMTATQAAHEMCVEPGTVERYLTYAYAILEDDWGDDTYLYGLDLNKLSAEERAFHRFTLPPR